MDNFSNLMMIGECLLDHSRTSLFKKALRKVLKHGDVVLDAGTGSGILAMLAAELGASKVYAVEIDPVISDIARQNVKENKLDKTVEVITADIKSIQLPRVDVVIIEMMDTGLISEQQLLAINNLHESKTIDKDTKIIPFTFETYIQFINYDFKFYGFNMPFIVQARNFGVKERVKTNITNTCLINKVTFVKPTSPTVLYKGNLLVKKSGSINSFLLLSKIDLCEGISSWGTTDMNMPVVVPVPEKKVRKGDTIEFSVGYVMSYGFSTLKFSWL